MYIHIYIYRIVKIVAKLYSLVVQLQSEWRALVPEAAALADRVVLHSVLGQPTPQSLVQFIKI